MLILSAIEEYSVFDEVSWNRMLEENFDVPLEA
jgi:hypothetical protein